MRFEIDGVTGERLAKRMLKLAWTAANVVGSGFLQDRGPGMTEDELWNRGCDNRPTKDSGRVSADYLFGRMMKLGFAFTDSTVESSSSEWRIDYQSFCRKYPNFKYLVESAAKELGATVREATAQAV